MTTGLPTDRREMLALTTAATMVGFTAAGTAKAAATAKSAAIMHVYGGQPFDEDWRFRRGAGDGLEQTAFHDRSWREVHLPHDWGVEDLPGATGPTRFGPFDKSADGETAVGFTEGGEGWYRKHFKLASAPSDAHVELHFDGVQGECDVWLNGTHLASHLYGYAPFTVDLTPAIRRDGENVLALRVRNIGKNSRWYAGSGLYRQVRLDVSPAGARIPRWGLSGWTRRIEGATAEIDVETQVEAADPALTVVARLRDASGRVVAEASTAAAIRTRQTLRVRAPRLWSLEEPYLHSLETELRRGDKVINGRFEPFGIRIVTISTANGLQVNGKRMVLRGACMHHDNGLLGACSFAQADDRRVALLKARGYNAIRSSHNPASQTFLDACDRHGMLLINEAFDMWHMGKNPDDYARHFATDWDASLRAMVLASRNRASVFMWSIGNEIPDRSSATGVEWSWKLANAVRRIDPTRPVTAALNNVLGPIVTAGEATARPRQAGKRDNTSSIFLDVSGYNYRLDDVERDHSAHPERVIYGSETYPSEALDYVRLAQRAPYMLGEFVWTGMDYIGEAGIGKTDDVVGNGPAFSFGTWPWYVSWCGDLDLLGNQKPPSLWRDVVWGISPLELVVHSPTPKGKHEQTAPWGWPDVRPSWTWPGQEGKPMDVHVYTSAERIELRIDGRKVGEAILRPEDKMRARLSVPYAAGNLEAVAYTAGRVIARRRLETVGAPARLRLRAERPSMAKDRQGLGYVAVEVLDAKGRIVPDAQIPIELTVAGPAELAGFGSANPLATGSLQSTKAQSFRGRALAIVRGKEETGSLRITARSPGLADGSAAMLVG